MVVDCKLKLHGEGIMIWAIISLVALREGNYVNPHLLCCTTSGFKNQARLHIVLAFLTITQQQRGSKMCHHQLPKNTLPCLPGVYWKALNYRCLRHTAVVSMVFALEGFHCIPYSRLGYDSRTANYTNLHVCFVLFSVKGRFLPLRNTFVLMN